jgi:hypothetical protein
MFIDTWLIKFLAPEERNVHGCVSLLRSLDRFVIGVAINILLLRSLNAFGCGSAAMR